MEVEVIKRKGIDSLVRGYSPGKVEEEKKTSVVLNHDSKQLLAKYEQMLQHKEDTYSYDEDDILGITEILTPFQINAFLQLTLFHKTRRWYGVTVGTFINKLIRNSYTKGHNDFYLNVTAPFNSLGLEWKGHESRLSILVLGDINDHCGDRGRDLDIKIDGNARHWLGYGSINSSFQVQGKVGSYCAFLAHGSTFTFYSDVLQRCGERSKLCTFKATKESSLHRLLDIIPSQIEGRPSGNRVIFIHADSREEMIKDYGS